MRPTTSLVFQTFLKKGSKKWRPAHLLAELKGLVDEGLLQIELAALEKAGWLMQDEKGRYQLNLLGRVIRGPVQVRYEEAYLELSPFRIPIRLGDFRKLKVLPSEEVEVEVKAVYPEEVLGRLIGRVSPPQRLFVGVVELGRNHRLYVQPQQPPLALDFQLPKGTPTSLIGQKVAVRFTSWGLKYPVAEVVQVLGEPRLHHTEMHAIMYEYALPEAFPPEVLAEAETLPKAISEEELETRHDFRGVWTCTIDPEDAKDFDDAISFRKLSETLYEVGVHIADVSYYVRPGSCLDEEAYKRATSVYLVDRTIPMLPERLSADLCSLRPQEDRLAFSVVFQMDAKAKVHAVWMGKTVIRSQRRFSYEEAQAVLEKGQGPEAESLRILNGLAKRLHQARMAEGGIRFETEEVRFVLDEAMRPVRLFVKARQDTHKLIEELMLLANRHVAKFLAQQAGLPTLYRVHQMPDPDRLRALKLFLEGFGYSLDIQNARSLTNSLNDLIEAIQGKPEARIIQTVAIRTLPKALYTSTNVGHYGLGFPYYTHFTSPIRRYPDLVVHRILWAVLSGIPSPYPNVGVLEEVARHCSEQEKLAEAAERASIRYKQLEYLSAQQNRVFDGIIVGIESWGLYVEIPEVHAEGLVAIRDLPPDMYERSPHGHALKARYSRLVFRLGDRVQVRLSRIDFDRRQIDLVLLSHEGRPIATSKKFVS